MASQIIGSALLCSAKQAFSALAGPSVGPSSRVANGLPANSSATVGAAGPDSQSTVCPGSHGGGPMIEPSTTRSGPSSSPMARTVSGATALASR